MSKGNSDKLVYFCEMGSNGTFKIGIAKDMDARAQALEHFQK
jgi:hypothetical protein